jgi:hypothetical protein
MKRQIICNKCRHDQIGHIKDYPGEWWKSKPGKALSPLLVCDSCGKPIEKNAVCHAQSFGRYDQGIPYYEWEQDYIEVHP